MAGESAMESRSLVPVLVETAPSRRAAPHPMAPPPPAGFHFSDLLVTVALRWRLLVLAALVPAALGLGGAFLAPTQHTAESVLLVQTAREAAGAPDITGFGPNVVAVEVLKVARTESEILTSPEVIRDALYRVPHGTFGDAARSDDQAVEAIRRTLRTEIEPGSTVLRVFLPGRDRLRAMEGLDAIMAAYFERRQQIFADEGARLLLAQIEQTNARIRTVDERLREVRAEARVLDIAQDIQLANSRREELAQRENRVREQQATVRAQLAGAEQALSAQPQRVVAFTESTNLRPNDDSRNQLARLLQERAHVTMQYAPDWPGLRDLDRRIATLRNVVQEQARTNFSTTREVRNPNQEMLSQRVLTLQLEARSLEGQLGAVTEQREEAERRATSLLFAEQRLRELGREREALEGIVRQLATREAGTRIGEEARRAGRAGVQVIQQPIAPLAGRSLKRVIVAAGIVLGIGLAAALALVLTLMRRTSATPAEAARALGLPALARFERLPGQGERLTPTPELENLAALLRDTRVDERRPAVVQFMGTAASDGQAELARALAVTLAQREIGNIALIDLASDGREHLSALGSQPVRASWTQGDMMILTTVLPRLFIAFEAAKSDLASPRASAEQVEALLRRLRRTFETVVIVAPADHSSYAARRLMGAVDANVMVVRGERTRLGEARALRDAVIETGGAALGFAYTGQRRVLPKALAHLA